MLGYDFYSLVILFPLLILSMIIQVNLSSTYTKYSKVSNSRGMTGAQIAKNILSNAGVHDVSVEIVNGKLTDHFDPRKKVIRLSLDVYNGSTIAAIGIAAHETGHALQYAVNYTPMRLRSAVVGITNFSSKILYFVIILSFVSNLPILCNIAVICFFIIFMFQLITLPVEFNASSRAIKNIEYMGYTDSEVRAVKKVLTSAAMTYVAAMLTSFGQMLAYFLRTRDRR